MIYRWMNMIILIYQLLKRNANPELLWFASCIFLIVSMAVITKITTLQLCCRFFKCYSTVFYTQKKINMTSLEHLLPPGKRKIYNMTTNLEPYNVFFPPDIMALEPSFDVPIVNITVVAGKTAVLPCSIDSLGDFKVSHIYSYM